MPVRYFTGRPTTMKAVEWTGENLEEIRDFWEPVGYSRYAFDVDVDGNLTNPSGVPLEPGTLTIMAGGFSFASEANLLEGMQEIDNPVGLEYNIVEQP